MGVARACGRARRTCSAMSCAPMRMADLARKKYVSSTICARETGTREMHGVTVRRQLKRRGAVGAVVRSANCWAPALTTPTTERSRKEMADDSTSGYPRALSDRENRRGGEISTIERCREAPLDGPGGGARRDEQPPRSQPRTCRPSPVRARALSPQTTVARRFLLVEVKIAPVSYTHLTLPTILLV